MRLVKHNNFYINLDNVAFMCPTRPDWCPDKEFTQVVFVGLSKDQELLLDCTPEEFIQEIQCNQYPTD